MIKKLMSYFHVILGWPMVIGIILAIISYYVPKWLSDDIKIAETALHIPVVDLEKPVDKECDRSQKCEDK